MGNTLGSDPVCGRFGVFPVGDPAKRKARPAIRRRPPWRRGGFSLKAFVPRYLHGRSSVVAFRPSTRSYPRLGLVRSDPASRRTPAYGTSATGACPAVPKQKNCVIFVNTEGLRPCSSKPSYGASQWALIIRLMGGSADFFAEPRDKPAKRGLFHATAATNPIRARAGSGERRDETKNTHFQYTRAHSTPPREAHHHQQRNPPPPLLSGRR